MCDRRRKGGAHVGVCDALDQKLSPPGGSDPIVTLVEHETQPALSARQRDALIRAK